MPDEGLDFQVGQREQQPPVSAPPVQAPPEPVAAQVTEPAQEAPVLEPAPVLAPAPEPHPLEPGGVRFKQVVARSHKERERADALEVDLQTMRAELDALKRLGQTPVQTPSWVELEAAIAEGRITRAQANDFREKELLKHAEQAVEAKIIERQRDNTIAAELNRYQVAVPALLDTNSDIRQRADQEFDFLMDLNGRDNRLLTPNERRRYQLQAIRTVLGPAESIRVAARPQPEPTMEVHSSQTKPTPRPNPDQEILNKLTPVEVTHYRKMMAAGQYKDWAEVVAEIKWQPPVRR